MAMEKLSFFFFLISAASAQKVPVLLWSSNRPLSDLPQSYAGHTVETASFQHDYLSPLTQQSQHNLVVFIQDKLSLEDFTNHADVYNPTSDGGAFKNVKASMDDQFSVHLPSVKKPAAAVDALIRSFKGTVHRVDNPEQLLSLELSDGKSNLIIVTLQPTRGHDEAEAFSRNDEMMGKCMKHLSKRDVQYTAIYTAQASSKADGDVSHTGRNLLEVFNGTDIYNGTFVNMTYENKADIMVYLRTVRLNLTLDGTSHDAVLPSHSLNIEKSYMDVNSTMTMLVMELEDDNVTVTFKMNSSMIPGTLDWNVASTNVLVVGKAGGSWAGINETAPLEFSNNVTSQVNFSFHCSRMPAYDLKLENVSNANLTLAIVIDGFQYQPFAGVNNSAFFSDAMDCVEFFSAPIWMGLFSTIILLSILFFGITMISNITTMDRFDDPKGKTITVTVNE